MRWLTKIYPKDIFADRRAAVLADGMLLVCAIVALFVLAVSLI